MSLTPSQHHTSLYTQPMGIINLVRRFRAHGKLIKGQCITCHATLRDDATDNCCSEECRFAHFLDTFV